MVSSSSLRPFGPLPVNTTPRADFPAELPRRPRVDEERPRHEVRRPAGHHGGDRRLRQRHRDQGEEDARSRRPAMLWRLHAIDAIRLQERRSWVVSFSILSAFRARSRLDISHTGGHRRGRLPERPIVQVSKVPAVLRRRDDVCRLRTGVEGADGHMPEKSTRLKES